MNEEWKLALFQKRKLRTYIKFKDIFITEEYTKHCNSRRNKSLLAQFGMGILPLAIETGRFKGLTENKRICQSCPYQTIKMSHISFVFVVYTLFEELLCIILYVKDI